MDKDNANPTILSLSQLPTRQAKKRVVPTGPGTKYRDLIFSRPAYLSGSSDDESDWGGPDDMDVDGDFAEEPIDAQEIYGKTIPLFRHFHSCLASPPSDAHPRFFPHGCRAEHGLAEFACAPGCGGNTSRGRGPWLPHPLALNPLGGGLFSDATRIPKVAPLTLDADLISTISDPEHPLSLGQLAVVNLPDIHLTPTPSSADPDALVQVVVGVTPTITHCSLATIIGLGVRVRLEQALPPNYRVDVRIKEGAHTQDDQVNKQLADKERVAAALENQDLNRMLESMLSTCT